MASFQLNGALADLDPSDHRPLLDAIRETHGLTGTKLVCGSGVCGACTVLVDGVPKVSCLTPCSAVSGRAVITVEAIGGADLHPVQRAFMANDALQCGFCTPGFIVEAVAFHDAWRVAHGTRVPSRDEIAAALAGHLCRCGAYAGIYRAVAAACGGEFDGAAGECARVEAREKVTGAAKYTVDIKLPEQLEGSILRANIAHGRITAIDVAAAKRRAGVVEIVMLAKVGDVVRHQGHALAAVAADDLATAKAALDDIRVRYDAYPSVIGYDASRAPGAAVLYSGFFKGAPNSSEGPTLPMRWSGNVRGPAGAFSLKPKLARQRIADARAKADPLLVEGVWRTEAQSHTSFEPHAAVASFTGDQLTVYLSTQAISHVAKGIAKRFGLKEDHVEVIAEHVGGGFGSKLMITTETVAAVTLARATGRPVRVVYDRAEELSVAGYRPGAELAVSLLPSASGDLTALAFKATADTGVGVNSTIATLARLMYTADAKALADYDAVSNLPAGAPFRGPGGPVMCFALEQAVDEAAGRLTVDPIALRQRWDSNPNRQRLYTWAAALPVWRDRHAAGHGTGRYRTGVGVAAANWLYWWQPGTEVELQLRGGRLVARCAVQDIGTGSRTVLAGTVAGAFGLRPDEIVVEIGRSKLPHAPISGGSRTTATIVPQALAASEKLKAVLRNQARGQAGDNRPWRDLIAVAKDVSVRAERPADSLTASPGVTSPLAGVGMIGSVFDWLLRNFAHINTGRGATGAVNIAEVEIDTWLGHVRVTRFYAGLAVGQVRAPLPARSQVEGSIIQGIGYALYEGRQVDPLTGVVLSAGLEDYRIPGIADTPEMIVHFDEQGFEHVPGGGVGLGEIATLPVAAAVANAVHNAIGQRAYALPIRPDRLLALANARRSA